MSGFAFSMVPAKVPVVRTKYRRIVTRIPAPKSFPIFRDLAKYESRSMHGQMPVVWDRARDFQVFDPYGNCWIDFTSTIFVTNTGHANKQVVTALRRQLDHELLHTYTYASDIRRQFLKKLVAVTPRQYEKAFLLSAGTEATECALKLMRLRGRRIRASKVVIISFQGCMHGRTMAAEMLKGNPAASAWIGYQDPNIRHLPFPYPWNAEGKKGFSWREEFKRNMTDLKNQGLEFKNIAGFIVESYLGWGAIFLPPEYVKALAGFARQYNALLTFDDIQGGFGRTGRFFAYQHYGVEPDIVCLGKGISGSVPLSAVMSSREIMDLPEIGSMSSTHSANPLACAAGLANLEEIQRRDLVREADRKGKLLFKELTKLQRVFPDRISHVLGKGMLAAILLKDPKTGRPDGLFASRVCERAMQKGLLLVHTGRESIKMGPPLTIPDAALLEGLATLAECLREIGNAGGNKS